MCVWVSIGTAQPPPALTLTSFPTSFDPARSASHRALTKTGLNVTMIPYSRSKTESSEDLSLPPEEVREPELVMGGDILASLRHNS